MNSNSISPSVYEYLKELKANNNREWFEESKKRFREHEAQMKRFFNELLSEMKVHDEIDNHKVFRIYRDVRFSPDKTPYKTQFSASFHRAKPRLRGGYYLHIEPENTFLACGFWDPDKEDLMRIRKEFEADDEPVRKIINSAEFRETFGKLIGEELKTAPKGFDRDDPAIDLIRKKQYIAIKRFSDKEAVNEDFLQRVNDAFKKIRPYFDYMSEVLTTDLNGVSLLP